MYDALVRKGYGNRKLNTTTRRAATTTFAAWCVAYAAACVVPLKLNADIVDWIVSKMQSSGEMDGIENIGTLEKILTHHRSPFRFRTLREWDAVLLTARVLLRKWEHETGGLK